MFVYLLIYLLLICRKKKEEAMLIVIQLAKHHPKVVHENTAKVAFLLCNEVKNFRQSVAGKAILTIGYLYEVMGRHFENVIISFSPFSEFVCYKF